MGVANFGNWKGSKAGKIKLHLVRPLHILKSPGKPTKNILGLKNDKRHVRMHIHIQLVHQWILFLSKGSTLTWYRGRNHRCSSSAVLSHQSWPSFITRRGQWEDTEKVATLWDLGAVQKHNLFPFSFTGSLSWTIYNPDPKGRPVDTVMLYSLQTEGERFWNRALAPVVTRYLKWGQKGLGSSSSSASHSSNTLGN